jgi:hemolysin activation/secretion protein
MICAVLIAPTGIASAQVVERNLPPESPRRAPTFRIDTRDLLKSDDATPFGVNVRAIVLIGAAVPAKRRIKATGIAADHVDGADDPAIRERLTPFLGRPLSRKLIAEVQATMAAVYRDAGRPFVSVTLPPQEVSTGVLQIRVIAFKVGSIKVTGAAAEKYQGDRIRIVPGAEVDTRRLETDLDWANRNPFRQVEAVFGPGRDLATTDVIIQVTDRRWWQVFAGYTNSGTLLTDRNRYFVGATAVPIGDAVASYQLTGSGKFWTNNGLLNDIGEAKYLSHAGRLLVPLGPRTSLEVVGDSISTNERPTEPFRIRTETSQVSAIVRTALSDLLRPAFGDLIAGVELKHQQRVTFFDGLAVAEGRADVAQWAIGWNGRWPDPLGSNNLDVRLKSNPGGVLPGNNRQDWTLFTNGRVDSVHTTFATVEFGRVTPLPTGWSLKSDISALASSQPLPDTERIGLGGIQGVRGYVTEDGVVDRAMIMRNSLYMPSFAMAAQVPGRVTPFVLADVGWGRDIFLQRDDTLASAGGGIGYQAAPNFNSNLTAAMALRDGPYTRAGSWRFSLQASVSY